MLKNYLKTALRTLRKDSFFTGINVVGLAVGMACFLLISLYIRNELSYDRFHHKGDRVARITAHYEDETGVRSFARSYPAIGPALKQDLTDVENTVRLQKYLGSMSRGDININEGTMFFAEQSFFDIFSFSMTRGDPKTALALANTAVLTETAVKRYFGDADPMGQIITLNDSIPFTVSGVLLDPPQQSHLKFEILLSFATWQNMQLARGRVLDQIWTSGTFYTYALLSDARAIPKVQAQLPAFIRRYLGDQADIGSSFGIALQPIRDIHLHSDLRQELGPNGSMTYVLIFTAVAIFILVISGINFINLSTARSAQRAREVGVRKVVGAVRRQLVAQYISESVVLSAVAMLCALVVLVLSLPAFNDFSGRSLTLPGSELWWFLPGVAAFAVLIGILAGAYPAIILSSFQPVKALKRAQNSGRRRFTFNLRQGLVVFQFTLSILIAASTIIALRQVDYMQNRDLGFDKERLLVLPFYWNSAVQNRYPAMKNQFLQNEAISRVTASGDVPGRMFTSMSYWIEGMAPGKRGGINALIMDPDFAETYGLKVVAGRDFSAERSTDQGDHFLLNLAAVAEMGLTPEEAVGKRFRMNGEGLVIGVIEDFHFEGLQQELEPLVMAVWPSWFGYITLRLESTNLPRSLAQIEEIWQANVPNRPFEYFFLDDDFNRLYQAEAKFGQVFMAFAALAIFISCLGLFGLAAFTASQRTKEIGVRKILGASVTQVILMLGRSFTWLVIIAAALASAAGFLVMNRWLQSFAYRVEIGWDVFVVTTMGALAIMWLTIGFQSAKAALINPARALRHE